MTMLMTDIRRRSIEGIISIDAGLDALGEKAKVLLGYGVLHQAKEVQEQKPLGTALVQLGVQVLVDADVERYQREKLLEVAEKKFAEWRAGLMAPSAYFSQFWSPSWSEVEVGKYREPIPVRVLELLVRIKEAVPDAEIKISHLEETPDPFAKVRLGGSDYSPKEQYWVAVWDEPGFGEGVRS